MEKRGQQLCVHCGQEFESWVADCADCGRPLSSRASGKRAQIARFDDPAEAQNARKILAAEQIEVEQIDSTGRPITHSLYVDHPIEQRAREILELARRRTDDTRQFQELAEERPAGPWVAGFRSARRRTVILRVTLSLNVILSAGSFALLMLIFIGHTHHSVNAMIGARPELWEAAGRLLSVGTLGLLALTLPLFLIWLHRVNQNTHALAVRDMTFSPARACGFILIPLVNLVGPFFVIKELWLANQSTDPCESAAGYRTRSAPAVVVAWWASTILWLPLARIGTVLDLRAETAAQIDGALLFSALTRLCPVAVFLLTLRIVGQIERTQLHRFELVSAS